MNTEFSQLLFTQRYRMKSLLLLQWLPLNNLYTHEMSHYKALYKSVDTTTTCRSQKTGSLYMLTTYVSHSRYSKPVLQGAWMQSFSRPGVNGSLLPPVASHIEFHQNSLRCVPFPQCQSISRTVCAPRWPVYQTWQLPSLSLDHT